MKLKTELTGHFLALMTVIIWGTTFISTKILLRDFTPIEILFLRFIIGFTTLFILYPHRLRFKELKHELVLAAAGLCGITLYFLLENIALTYTYTSNVGVIISIAPFFTALFSQWFLKEEPLKLNFLIGFLVALAGIILISFRGSTTFSLNAFGDILAILAAIVWAIYSILIKKINRNNNNIIQTTRQIFFYGLIFMIPALFLFGFQPNLELLLEPLNAFNFLFLGLGASALCFVTWNTSVKILGAIKTSVYIYLVPVITVLTSILVLHETITGWKLIGITLTLLGLSLSNSRSSRPKKEFHHE